jgi:hypothetical protein
VDFIVVRRSDVLLSRDQVLDHRAAELAELLEAAGVVVGEFVVVETEEAQEGDVEIADVGFAFDGGHAEFVGGSDGVAGIAAAAGEPEGHGVGIVVATVGGAAAHAVVGGAAELATPHDERAFEQSTLFEVGDEGSDGLVHPVHEIAMGTLNVVVAVPGTVVELHEANAFLDELAGKEAFAAKGVRGVVADAIEFFGFLIFLGEVESLGHLHLHAESEFVVVHARGEFVVTGMLRGVRGVEFGEQIEIAALTVAADAGGWREIENRRAFGPERRALEAGGEVTVAPVGRATLRVAHLWQHDEAGEVLVQSAKAVVHPRTDAGVAAEAVAAVHLIHRGGVVHAVHGATTEEAEVIGDFGEMRPVFRHVRAALAVLGKLERALNIVALAALHRGGLLVLADELLEVQFRQRGLGVEGVDVRGAAFHHEEDDVLRLRRKMAVFGCERILFRLFGEQGTEGYTAQRGSERIDEIAACGRMKRTASGTGEIGSGHGCIRVEGWRTGCPREAVRRRLTSAERHRRAGLRHRVLRRDSGSGRKAAAEW